MVDPRTEATLKSGDLETRYERAGAGPPVLLLAPNFPDPAPTDRLFDVLSRRFRVIRPLPAPGFPRPTGSCADGSATPMTRWIRGLIDGLGLERCALVAEGPFRLPALWFALGDPDRASRLVLVFPPESEPDGPRESMQGVWKGSEQRILVVRRRPREHGVPLTDEVDEKIAAFLLEESGPGWSRGAPAPL